MNSAFQNSLVICALALACSSASAIPMLMVSDMGLNASSNREWLVETAPDAALFNGGLGSLTVELAFEVSGSELVGAIANTVVFPFTNPGNNPFTSSTTFGLQVDTSSDTVFASFGSDLFASGDAVEALTIETLGSGSTTLSWGGHSLLPGSQFQYTGSRIAQDGVNFDGYQGSLTAGVSVTGDFDNSGTWNCIDIDLLVTEIATGGSDLAFDMNADGNITAADITETGTGWLTVGGTNNPSNTGGNAFLIGDANLDGTVDGADFLIWNTSKFTGDNGWCGGDFDADGQTDGADFLAWNANKFTSSDISAVPEPSSLIFSILLAFGAAHACRSRE